MLKFKYSKLEDIPEHLRDYYAEKDGAYYLQAEGMIPKSRLDEFRDNNTELMKERDALKAKLAGVDITPEELTELREKAKLAASKTKGLSDEEKAELVEAEVNKRIKKMQEENTKTVEGLQKSLGEKDNRLRELLIDNDARAVATGAGVRDEAVTDLINRVRSTFKVNDEGAVVALDDNGETIYGADGTTPLSINEWVGERKADAPHWFKESGGAGSQNQRGQKSATGGGNDDGLRGRSKMAAARKAG